MQIRPTLPRRQHGVSLIEILVGMAIAMIGVVIMMEVLLNSEQRTRSGNAGNDALSTGAVMSHMIRRDLVQAGYGINAVGLLGCQLRLSNGKDIPLAPVVINPGTTLLPARDPNTDSFLIVYGNDSSQPEGQAIKGVSGSAYSVETPGAFAAGQYVIGALPSCTTSLKLAKVTAVDAATGTVTVNDVEATASVLYNLGANPRITGYRIRDGQLMQCNYVEGATVRDCSNAGAANWTAVAGNVVALRAQYGRDTAAAGAQDGVVDLWDQTTPANACQWSRASAVRFALVTRSDQYESKIDTGTGARVCDQVTATTSKVLEWSGKTVDATNPTAVPIDLSKKPDGTANAEWQCYRYRTFETVAPTRNVVWMRTQAGC